MSFKYLIQLFREMLVMSLSQLFFPWSVYLYKNILSTYHSSHFRNHCALFHKYLRAPIENLLGTSCYYD